MAVASSIASVPAIALIGVAGAVEQSTEPFRERCGRRLQSLAHEERIKSVLTGEVDHTEAEVDGLAIAVEAVSDANGALHAVLTLTIDSPDPEQRPSSFLSERFDDSPALVWLKDLDGRYLHVNSRYVELLCGSEELVLGKTDRELAPRVAVDGPRAHGREPIDEPLQLEYTIGPFDGRPGFAVLRFAVRDRAGDPIGVCGVAAPLPQAQLSRTECLRLMQLERFARLDHDAARRELLEEWGMVHTRTPPDEPPDAPTPQRSVADNLRAELSSERERAEEAEAELERAQASRSEAEAALADARGQLERATGELQAAAASLSAERRLTERLRDELALAQEAAVTTPEPRLPDPAPAPPSARRWTPTAQRAFAAVLASASDWRTGLKDAVKVLGAVGGWDSVTAWCPGETAMLRCAAMWADAEHLGLFETLTWQRAEPIEGTELGRALMQTHATSVAAIGASRDPRLQSAADGGIRSALLVPVRDGVHPVAVLEFLSHESEAVDAELAIALEANGVQLGHFAHLLRLGARPQWRTGRV